MGIITEHFNKENPNLIMVEAEAVFDFLEKHNYICINHRDEIYFLKELADEIHALDSNETEFMLQTINTRIEKLQRND